MTSRQMAAAEIFRERLAADPGALAFAEAVFAQLVGPAGALASAASLDRDALALHLAELLDSPAAIRDDSLAERLIAAPPLAAAFFQNLDLLYTHHSPHADAMSALLMRALELATEREGGP